MGRQGVLGLAFAVVVIGLGWFLLAERAPRVGGVGRAGTAAAERGAAPAPGEPGPARAGDHGQERDAGRADAASPAAGSAQAPEADQAEARPGRWIEGRVLDVEGRPVAEVEIQAREGPGKTLARSLGDGSFRFETRAGYLRLEGLRPGYASVREAIVGTAQPSREALVVLAPAVDLAGRVVDAEGEGIDGAVLWVQDNWAGLVGFPLPLDGTEPRRPEARSGADGAFEFAAVPRLPSHPLLARADGFQTARLEVPETSRSDLEIRLEPSSAQEDPRRSTIFGVVSFADGSPAEGARVRLAQSAATSDRDGRFELLRAPWTGGDTLLVAMLEGWQPAVWGQIGPEPQERPARVGPLALILPGPVLSLAGRLERADGSPAAGWNVTVADPTVLDHNYNPAPIAETLGAEFRGWPRTDGQGRFELGGLAARDYTLRLWDPDTHLCLEAGPFPAGSRDLHLRVPGDALLESLRGRVVARGSVPIEGASVQVQFITSRTRSGYVSESVTATTSDAEGRFELSNLPRRHVQLLVGGDDLVWSTHAPGSDGFDDGPLEIQVERLARVRLDFSDLDPRPTTFQLLDAGGNALPIELRSAQGRSSTSHMSLQEGRSAVLAVGESAVTLVLMVGGRELSRRPVMLIAGEVNELAP